MTTSTAPARSAVTGCGCGGSATNVSGAFLRPRFFAGQLLTEDDLQALTAYVTGKDRLRNRLVLGPGVVCGLEVVCDPCGGGKVTVRPGYALDGCGNDIVVGCPERVDIVALLRDLGVRSLGADCGDSCDTDRELGLYVRYVEEAIAPIAPFPTDDSRPPDDCTPSRIRETYTFVVRYREPGDDRHLPARALGNRLGDLDRVAEVRAREHRLGRYRAPLAGAVRSAGAAVLFDDDTAGRFRASRTDLAALLQEIGDGTPTAGQARAGTEHVRALASAMTRHDLYDPAGQEQLRTSYPDLDIDAARTLLSAALSILDDTGVEPVWPDPLRRAVARAVLDQTRAVVIDQGVAAAPLEARLLAQGAPMSYPLRAELVADLGRLRQWLLVRLDKDRDLADCGLRPLLAGVTMPPALPSTPPAGREHASATELTLAADAAGRLGDALLRYVTDAACASILPPCAGATGDEVLLAHLELDGREVRRACAADRQQWLPGGPGYAAWAPVLYQARELAGRLCCQPPSEPAEPDTGTEDSGEPLPLPYVSGLLLPEQVPTELDQLLHLLESAGSPPVAQDDPSMAGIDSAGALRRELAELRDRIGGLTTRLGGLTDEVEALRAGPRPVAGDEARSEAESAAAESADAESVDAESAGSGRPAGKSAKATPGRRRRTTGDRPPRSADQP